MKSAALKPKQYTFSTRPAFARGRFDDRTPFGPRTADEQWIEDAKPGPMEWPKSARRVGCDHEFLIVQDRRDGEWKTTTRTCLHCGSYLSRNGGLRTRWWEGSSRTPGDTERRRVVRRRPAGAEALLVDAGLLRFDEP